MKIIFKNIKINASSIYVTYSSGYKESIFKNCSSLKALDLSNFNTSKVTDMIGMFRNCSTLETLDLSSFDTSKVTHMGSMFAGCSKLKTLDLSNFDTSKAMGMYNMFKDCKSLKEVKLPKDTNTREKIIEKLEESNIQCRTV